MTKILAIFVLALAVGSCVEAAFGSGSSGGMLQSIKGKLNNRGGHPRFHRGGLQSTATSTATATTTSTGRPEVPTSMFHHRPMQSPPHRAPAYYPQAYPPQNYPPQGYGYQQPREFYEPREVYSPRHPEPHGGNSVATSSTAAAAGGGGGDSAASSSAAAAGGPGGSAATSASAAVAANRMRPQQVFVPQSSPIMNHNVHPQYVSRPVGPVPFDINAKIAEATSSATGVSEGGYHPHPSPPRTHIPTGYGTEEVYRAPPVNYMHRPPENYYVANTGIFNPHASGINENSHYKSSTEEEKNHEEGSEESNHYLSTRSHSKAENENMRLRQGHDDLDEEINGNSRKTTKRSGYTNLDYNKSSSKSGSAVDQRDRAQSAYSRSNVKSRSQIDAGSTRYADGRAETTGLQTESVVDDEDSEYFNSDGIHGHHPGGPSSSAAAATATAAGAGGAASSSAAAAAAANGHH